MEEAEGGGGGGSRRRRRRKTQRRSRWRRGRRRMWRRSRRRILTVTMLSRGPVSTEYIGLPSISPHHYTWLQLDTV